MKITVTFDPDDKDDAARATSFMTSLNSAAPAAFIEGSSLKPVNTLAEAQAIAEARGIVAPAPAATPVTVQHDLTDRDTAGRPWDGRIHQQSKGKLQTGAKKGQWKTLKALDKNHPGLRESVEAELDEAYGGVTTPDTQLAPPPATGDTAPPAPPMPAGAPPVTVQLDPANQAVLDKVQRILAENPAVREGALANYNVAEQPTITAVSSMLLVYKCQGIDDVVNHPEHWEGLLAALEYTWPQG